MQICTFKHLLLTGIELLETTFCQYHTAHHFLVTSLVPLITAIVVRVFDKKKGKMKILALFVCYHSEQGVESQMKMSQDLQ